MLGADDLLKLGRSIQAEGQIHPILTWRGMIVDGRNREAACVRVGEKPKYKALPDDTSEYDIVGMIVAANIHRRHLTVEQRADIADELAKLKPGDNQHSKEVVSKDTTSPTLSLSEAADAMGVSRSTVARIREVKATAPDLAEKVKSGEMKVTRAATIARERVKHSTNPDLAADSVVDAAESRAAEGDTPRARSALATISKLDPTELTFIRPDLLRILGVESKQ